MKEFSLTIQDYLKKGIRPLNKEHRGTGLIELYNLEPTPVGLMPYNRIVSPFNQELLHLHNIAFEYPFPQIFIGKGKVFLCTSNKVYLVNTQSWDDFYELTLYDSDIPAQTASISSGNYWHLVDLSEAWFLTNGVDTVYFTGKDVMLGNAEKVYVKSGMPIVCGSYYKGRVVLGGFDSSKFWGSGWQTLWESWLDDTTIASGLSFERAKPWGSQLMPVGENWIWWSSIGGGDVGMLLSSTLAQTGYSSSSYGANDAFILELLKRNEQGFAQLPFIGTVLALKPLGDSLIAYTENGILALRHTVEPFSTLAQIDIPELVGIGLISTGALAGDVNHHVFLDNSGFLWEINRRLEVTPLGFREHFADFVGANPTINFAANPWNLSAYGEFYISQIGKCYKLVERGLCETGQRMTSSVYFGGRTIGVCTDYDKAEEGRFILDVFDWEEPGMKTIQSVDVFGTEVRYADKPKIFVAIDYRSEQSSTFKTTTYRQCNHQGVATFPVAGIDFRIRIKTNDYRRVDFNKVRVNIQRDDRRFQRSISIGKA